MPLPPRLAHLVGSKFTAAATIRGWRQFHVVGLVKVGRGYDAVLRASCDASVELTLPAAELFDETAWSFGWKRLAELSDA